MPGLSRKKKRVYVMVVALGIIALMVDRLILGPPRAASARLIDAASAVGVMAGEEAAQAGEALQIFPEQLPQPDWHGVIRVPFRLPSHIASRREQRLSGTGRSVEVPVHVRRPGEPLSVAEFARTHQLNGILVGSSASAIVDGQIVEVGRIFDASPLLKVEGNRAFFECKDGIAVLKVGKQE